MDPVTALTIGSTLFSAAGAIETGNAQAAAQKAQAAQADLNRQAERTQEAVEATERERQLKRIMAQQTALFGASGDLSSGSFQRIQQTSVSEAIREQRQASSLSSVRQAQLRLQAAENRTAARSARRRGYFSAGTTLLSGASGVADRLGG